MYCSSFYANLCLKVLCKAVGELGILLQCWQEEHGTLYLHRLKGEDADVLNFFNNLYNYQFMQFIAFTKKSWPEKHQFHLPANVLKQYHCLLQRCCKTPDQWTMELWKDAVSLQSWIIYHFRIILIWLERKSNIILIMGLLVIKNTV